MQNTSPSTASAVGPGVHSVRVRCTFKRCCNFILVTENATLVRAAVIRTYIILYNLSPNLRASAPKLVVWWPQSCYNRLRLSDA